MTHKGGTVVCVGRSSAVVAVLCTLALADGFVAPRGGLLFPRMVQGLQLFSEKAAWNIGVEGGGLGSAGVGAGGSFDFSYQRTGVGTRFDNVYDDDIAGYEYDRIVRRTRLSLGGFVYVDPLRRLPVHPAFRAGFKPTMLLYTNRETDDIAGLTRHTETSGVYWGVLPGIGLDLHVRIGGDVTLFGSFEYEWGSLWKRRWLSTAYYVQSARGPGVRVGVRFL